MKGREDRSTSSQSAPQRPEPDVALVTRVDAVYCQNGSCTSYVQVSSLSARVVRLMTSARAELRFLMLTLSRSKARKKVTRSAYCRQQERQTNVKQNPVLNLTVTVE